MFVTIQKLHQWLSLLINIKQFYIKETAVRYVGYFFGFFHPFDKPS